MPNAMQILRDLAIVFLGVGGLFVGLWGWAFLRPDLLLNPVASMILTAPQSERGWHRGANVSLLEGPWLSRQSTLAEIEYHLVRSGFSYWTMDIASDATLAVTHMLPGKAAIPACGQVLFVDVVIRDRNVVDVVGHWTWTCV